MSTRFWRSTSFWRFFAVGLIGFAVDATALLTLIHFGLAPLLARCISFLVAVAATYKLNSRYTFMTHRKDGSYRLFGPYVAIQLIGVATNFPIFMLVINSKIDPKFSPFIGLIAASAASLVITFSCSKLLFAQRNSRLS